MTFIQDNQSRVTRYTVNFIDVTNFETGVQATAPATRKGNTLVISDAWYMVKVKDGAILPGVYEIVGEEKKGKITHLKTVKK